MNKNISFSVDFISVNPYNKF